MSANLISRLQIGGEFTNSLFYTGKLDLVYDAADHKANVQSRELYIEYNKSNFNARLGRQIITLGVGDLVFINDIFSKDWNAFFLGMPQEYLKLGTDAARFDWYGENSNFEIILARFGADQPPNPSRFILPQPTNPNTSNDDLEIALKASAFFGSWEVAAYAAHAYFRQPVIDYDTFANTTRSYYPRLNTYGASTTGPFAGGVVSVELGYYDAIDDPYGVNSVIENSQNKVIIAYSKQIWQDATLSIQYFNETLRDYSAYLDTTPISLPIRHRSRQTATLRLTQMLHYQTITLGLYTFFGLTEGDQYWIPSVKYSFNDHVWAELGANIYTGSREGQYGVMHNNSNLFMTMRYSF